jgi:hypothetical protein
MDYAWALSATCEFGTGLEDRLIYQFLHVLNNEEIAFRLAMKNLPLDRSVAKACLYELVVDCAKETAFGSGTVAAVQRIRSKKITSQNSDKPVGRGKTASGPEKGCFRCKGLHYLSQCPDRAKKCSKCGNKGLGPVLGS